MMKKIFLTVLSLCSIGAMAQFVRADSWMLNTDGTLAVYEYFPGPPPTTETVEMPDSADVLQICYDDEFVYIRTNGLPSYLVGPWHMNPNEPEATESTYRIRREPIVNEVKDGQPFGGAMGIAVNGVKLYGAGDAKSYDSDENENNNMGDGLWNGDAWASEGETMDVNGAGHPDGMGNYHYHATPVALYGGPGEHSPIIGWAFDGFPIYGPYGYDNPDDPMSEVVRMETSYQMRDMDDRSTLPDGTPSVPPGPSDFDAFPLGTYWEDREFIEALGHLDQYNGRECKTPDFPDGTYAYFVTIDEEGVPAFPYLTGLEYYGDVIASDIGGGAGDIVMPDDVICVGDLASVPELFSKSIIEVYPNPTNGELNINGALGAKYQVLNQMGQVMMQGINDGLIDVNTLTPGIYVIAMDVDGETTHAKFVKS